LFLSIPTHIGLYLVEEDAIRDVVGREALIPQEIMGRAHTSQHLLLLVAIDLKQIQLDLLMGFL
jgi:hypothetical protein